MKDYRFILNKIKLLNKQKILIIILIGLAISGWALALSNSFIAKADEPFDHSVCQYPYRLSNPANGCDNSDPACPLEIKGGTCENYQPTEKELEPWTPVETTKPVENIMVSPTPATSPTNTCTCPN